MSITPAQMLALQNALGPALTMPAEAFARELELIETLVASGARIAVAPTSDDHRAAHERQRKAAAEMRKAIAMRGSRLSRDVMAQVDAAMLALEGELEAQPDFIGRDHFYGQRPAAELSGECVQFLALLFEKATGNRATMITDPDTGKRSGPFLKFAIVALPIFGKEASVYTIERAVLALNKRRRAAAKPSRPYRASSKLRANSRVLPHTE